MLDKTKIDVLAADIKKKKELQSINDDFVKDGIVKCLQQEPKLSEALEKNFNPKSKAYGSVVKYVRAKLRKVYGLFRDDPAKRKKLVQELARASKENRTKIITEILSTHSSTNERLSFYGQLYSKLFAITGKPKTILDLGCGINPFSFLYMKLEKCNYYAYDINEEEINSINKCFGSLQIENPFFTGKAEIMDILQVAKLPQADICFLFKMTDVLDKGKGHKKTEELLIKIPAKYIVASFATKTMSGKAMTAPRRKWMEWLCQRLGYNYTVLEFKNEIFYVVEKK